MPSLRALTTTIFLSLCGLGHAAAPLLSVQTFERSAVFRKHRLQEKDSWALRSGGRNFYYRFDNPALKGESMVLEMQGSAAAITRLSVSWPGDFPVNRLDAHEATFLQEVAELLTTPAVAKKIVSYARAGAGRSYPDGSSAMPRTVIGGLKVFAGQNMQLIVGIEK